MDLSLRATTFILAQERPARGNICKLYTRGVPKIPAKTSGVSSPYQNSGKGLYQYLSAKTLRLEVPPNN